MKHIQDYISESVAARKAGKYGIKIGMKLDDFCELLKSCGVLICDQDENISEMAAKRNRPCYQLSPVEIKGKRYLDIKFPDGDLFSMPFENGMLYTAFLIGGPNKGIDYSTGNTKKTIETLNKRLEEI